MSTQTTPAPTPHASSPRGGVNPGFGKFLAGLILGLVVGLAAGAVLPTVLGLGGSALGGETPGAGGATGVQPGSKPKTAVMPPPAQPVDQEPRRPGPAQPQGATPPAPAPGELPKAPGEAPKPEQPK